MAAAISEQQQDEKPYSYKVPRGGERNQCAPCYHLGLFMAAEIKEKGTNSLKHVSADEIRDGSIPQVEPVANAVDEDWKDEAHVVDSVPELAHLNNPKHDEVIRDEFLLHFVDPRSFDRKIRLVFKPTNYDTGHQYTMDLEMFGNQIKQEIKRPSELQPGSYSEFIGVSVTTRLAVG
jgi:hypothetical protein